VASAFTLPDAATVEAMGAEEILRTVLDAFRGKVALACSFQKEEAVLLDLLFELDPKARVFALDTHVLFPETYAVWREVERRYSTQVEVFQGPSLGRQAATHGDALWERNPELCCSIRKVAPLARALSGLDAWITGLRRDQSPTRANAPKLLWDESHELWKANPLADWTDDDCWAYIKERNLPYNELHDRGYSSIGCTHCTLPGAGRAGRWAGSAKTECGLHVASPFAGSADEAARGPAAR
jgi:phosphoadenosine phosphosulfate reductase